ncbi:MAG: tRNA (adenosine(37)-N6)-dimethylallyltransferase MiaA [Fimbriimonadaceae bacterium]|nr:tRNA (adenosine(37)-N6)-dimethylallyltransferase MiaA [Fimbriimonadaceae bacterium]
MNLKMIAVMGPTGSGKSGIAEIVAKKIGAQLINADAFQVYRGLDIGTNKPTDCSPYELIDIVDPTEQFGLGEWIKESCQVLDQCWKKSQPVVFVGGTGLYIRALFEGYSEMSGPPDEELREQLMLREKNEGLQSLVDELTQKAKHIAEATDLKNPVRVRRALERIANPQNIEFNVPPYQKAKFSIVLNQETLKHRISSRLEQMVKAGWIEEVERLLTNGVPENAPGFRAIGYHTWVRLLKGELSLDEGKAEVLQATLAYAKRQRTWLRKEPGITEIPFDPVTADTEQLVGERIWALLASANG